MTLTLKSVSMTAGDLIPQKFTCDGMDTSPHLTWEGAPQDTASFALIMDDPDAPMGTWDHWIVFNIPGEMNELEEGVRQFPQNVRFGRNSWGRLNYGGPCPPDREHTYIFKLYALNAFLELENGTSKRELEAAMEGHVLAYTDFRARYDRPRR